MRHLIVKLTVKGSAELNYRIEKKSVFRIVGIAEHYALNIEEGFDNVPSLWQKAREKPTECSNRLLSIFGEY